MPDTENPSPEMLEHRRMRLHACMATLGDDPMNPEAAVVVAMLVKLYGCVQPGSDQNAQEGKSWVALPTGFSFTETEEGDFAVRRGENPAMACLVITADGLVDADDVPWDAVTAAIDQWRSTPRKDRKVQP